MIVSSGSGRPVALNTARVGVPDPEASTTRSAESSWPSLPPSSNCTPVTAVPSGDSEQFADAAAVSQGNVRVSSQPSSDREFNGRARQRVVDQANITLWKWVVVRPFGSNINSHSDRDGACCNKVALKARKQLAERTFSSDQQSVSVSGLRRAGPMNCPIGKGVALENDDVLEEVRQGPGRSQACNTGANDDCLACNCLNRHGKSHASTDCCSSYWQCYQTFLTRRVDFQANDDLPGRPNRARPAKASSSRRVLRPSRVNDRPPRSGRDRWAGR